MPTNTPILPNREHTLINRFLDLAEISLEQQLKTEEVRGNKMSSQNINILLAEDEPQVRNMLATVLRGHGYNVLEAVDGKEALKVINDHFPGEIDLLLSDVVMPYVNSTEVASQFMNLYPNSPIILMSGYTEDKILDRIKTFKDVAFIPKPFMPQVLTDKIDQMLKVYA